MDYATFVNELQALAGETKIISFKGQGTSIEIKVPVVEDTEPA